MLNTQLVFIGAILMTPKAMVLQMWSQSSSVSSICKLVMNASLGPQLRLTESETLGVLPDNQPLYKLSK